MAQLHALFAQTRSRLELVAAPVQLFRSTVDNVVSEASVRELVAGLAPGTLAEHHMLLHSKHVATLDYDAEQISTSPPASSPSSPASRQAPQEGTYDRVRRRSARTGRSPMG